MKQRSKQRALLPRAGLAPGIDFFPKLALVGHPAQFRPVAGFSGLLPLAQLGVLLDFVHAIQHGLLLHVVKLLPAQVVGAALHQRHFHLRKELFQEGDVLVKELLLKVLRSSGDDRA